MSSRALQRVTNWPINLTSQFHLPEYNLETLYTWLHDDAAAGSQCGGPLPGEHKEWIVPRNDLSKAKRNLQLQLSALHGGTQYINKPLNCLAASTLFLNL